MQERFSEVCKEMIENALKKMHSSQIPCLTSEYLLLSMFQEEESFTRYLLEEIEITEEKLVQEINTLYIIRKKENSTEFSQILLDIFYEAGRKSRNDHQPEIYEEYLLWSMLESNCIATYILEKLEASTDTMIEMIIASLDSIKEEKKEEPTDFIKYTKNYTKMVMDPNWVPYVSYSIYLERTYEIIKRKTKSNPILVGKAGVGKTAIVEGFAKYLLDHGSPYEIYGLELGGVVAGTKYRGDFEERLLHIIEEVESHPNYILFIDEIHNILGAGSSDGSLDAANILKPALARGGFKCIGATTIEEYQKKLETDKALTRRFQPIFVYEPNDQDTKRILYGIKPYYEKYHQCKFPDDLIEYLVLETKNRIPQKVFPDKAIDILDESLTIGEIQGISQISKQEIQEAFQRLSHISEKKRKDIPKEYQIFYLYQALHFYPNHRAFSFLFYGTENSLQIEKKKWMEYFGFLQEEILEMNLSFYNEPFMKSSLIGAPPGYVGYEAGGILSEHIHKYPHSLILIEGFDRCHNSIQSFITDCIKNGFFYDARSRYISCEACGYVFYDTKNRKEGIGFLSSHLDTISVEYDTVISRDSHKKEDTIFQALQRNGYHIINALQYQENKEIEFLLYELFTKETEGEFEIEKNHKEQTLSYKKSR